VSSVYASRIASLSGRFGLDAATSDEAQSSLGSAQRVGGGLGAQASAFIEEANKIFVDAMAIGMRVSILVVAFAFVMAWKFLPARAAVHASTPADNNDDGVAEPSADRVAVAPPATATLSAGE
jgi:hypothetical protein